MLNINIICIGKIKENYLKDAISEYSKSSSIFFLSIYPEVIATDSVISSNNIKEKL